MSLWGILAGSIPDALKGAFGIVDQLVTDKDQANALKAGLAETYAGKGSQYWLQANAFSLAMLANLGMVITLHFMGGDIPVWSLTIALLWLAGPLLNVLSKETIGKVVEMVKEYYKQKEGKND